MATTPGNELPGAYPMDAASTPYEETASSHRNKLHKRDDPRGWTDNENTPRTENMVAPALASSQARDPSSTSPKNDYTYGSQQSSSTQQQAGPGMITGAYSRVHNQSHPASSDAAAGLTSSHDTGGLVSGARNDLGDEESTSQEGTNTVRSGLGNKSSLDNSEPYWGDIPRGAGTYNTVVGHGSVEDSVEGHPQHREFPLSTHGRHDTSHGIDPSESTAKSGSPTSGQGTYNTVVGHGSQEDRALRTGHHDDTMTSTQDSQDRDNHTKEIAAGAGAAGLGGYAAHKHASKDDEMTGPAESRKTNDEKEHKLGGLLHREHKDEPVKHEKVKHEKDSKIDKDDGEKKFLGIFSRSKKDADESDNTSNTSHATRIAEDPSMNTTTPATHVEEDRHSGRDATLAGASALGGGYAGYQYANRDSDREQDTPTRGGSPKDKKESKLHGLFHRNQNKEDLTPQTFETLPPNAAEYYNGKEASEMAAEKERRGKISQGEALRYGESSADPSISQRTMGPSDHSTTNEKLAYASTGAAGAGLISSAHASHNYNEPHNQTNLSSGTMDNMTPAPGTTTGAGPDLRTKSTHARNVPSSSSPHDTTGSSSQYNNLSSGTPSGINTATRGLGENKVQPSSDVYPSERGASHDNDTSAYAGAGAAGAAGAAAYGAYKMHDHHENDTQPSSTTAQRLRSETTNTTAIPSTQRSAEQSSSMKDKHNSTMADAGAPAAATAAAAAAYRNAEDRHAQPTTKTTSLPSGTHGTTHTGNTGANTADLGRSSQDSSKGGQYNVLASGTPSGINLDEKPQHLHSQHDSSQQRSIVHDPLTSSSQDIDRSKMAATGGAAALAAAGAAGYAGSRGSDAASAPTATDSSGKTYDEVIANAPERKLASGTNDADIHGRGLMSGTERKTDTSTDPNAGSAAYENKPTAPGPSSTAGGGLAGGLGAAGAGAAARGGLSKPVMHTCTECGKQNDISSYFKNDSGGAQH